MKKVIKTLFNIELVNREDNNTEKNSKNTRRIISKKKLAEMSPVLVDQEKNINNVMELKFQMLYLNIYLF